LFVAVKQKWDLTGFLTTGVATVTAFDDTWQRTTERHRAEALGNLEADTALKLRFLR
jgi:hypothetical protein